MHTLLRLPEVKAVTGLSKSTIYARIADGNFPKQIPIGPRLVVWMESDIENWIAQQVLLKQLEVEEQFAAIESVVADSDATPVVRSYSAVESQ